MYVVVHNYDDVLPVQLGVHFYCTLNLYIMQSAQAANQQLDTDRRVNCARRLFESTKLLNF